MHFNPLSLLVRTLLKSLLQYEISTSQSETIHTGAQTSERAKEKEKMEKEIRFGFRTPPPHIVCCIQIAIFRIRNTLHSFQILRMEVSFWGVGRTAGALRLNRSLFLGYIRAVEDGREVFRATCYGEIVFYANVWCVCVS